MVADVQGFGVVLKRCAGKNTLYLEANVEKHRVCRKGNDGGFDLAILSSGPRVGGVKLAQRISERVRGGVGGGIIGGRERRPDVGSGLSAHGMTILSHVRTQRPSRK